MKNINCDDSIGNIVSTDSGKSVETILLSEYNILKYEIIYASTVTKEYVDTLVLYGKMDLLKSIMEKLNIEIPK